jgi:hypothetical protein
VTVRQSDDRDQPIALDFAAGSGWVSSQLPSTQGLTAFRVFVGAILIGERSKAKLLSQLALEVVS